MPICGRLCSTVPLFARINMPRGPKKYGAQAIGRSRGGLSTKIHVATDALGNPMRCRLTGGEAHDITQGPALMEGFQTQQVITDKGYDSEAFVMLIEATGAQAVIPPRKTRRELRAYDRDAYRERHLIECFFNRLKQFRRVATRYEKLACNFLSMINLAAAFIWLL